MDRTWLLDRLANADRYVTESQERVTRQRQIVEQLSREGHDVTANRAMLREFERSLAARIEHRDNLRSLLERQAAEQSPRDG